MDLPRESGTYVLFLHLRDAQTLPVGRLGTVAFPAGFYAYVGSGRGSGGLAARIARHLRGAKARHWHIDALRERADPVRLWLSKGTQRRECAWAGALSNLPGASLPAPRFGASDCRCAAHLIRFAALPDRASFSQAVGEAVEEVDLHGPCLE